MKTPSLNLTYNNAKNNKGGNVDKIFRWTFHFSTQRFFKDLIWIPVLVTNLMYVEKPNFYLWPGTSHQSSSGLRAMIHYWLIVYDPIIDNQKWVPLILSPMSKLDSVLCKGLTFACSELSLSLFCGSDLSFLKYLSTNLKYLKSSIK